MEFFLLTLHSLFLLLFSCILETFYLCRVLEQVKFSEKFSSLPQFNPEETPSPSTLSLPSSPRNILSTFRKKRMPSGEFRTPSDVSESLSVHHTSFTPSCLASDLVEGNIDRDLPMEPMSAPVKLTGSTFFGPDFNLEAFRSET